MPERCAPGTLILNKAQSAAAEILDRLYEKYGVVGVGDLSEVATSADYEKAEYCACAIWGKPEEQARAEGRL